MHARCSFATSSRHPVRSLVLPPLSAPLSTVGLEFLPAVLLPEQFHSSPPLYQKSGEVALMRAVLDDAIECFQKQFSERGARTQRLAKEAEEWLFSDYTVWPFSFVNICHALGLDPAYIRRALIRWRQHPVPQPRKKRRRRSIGAQHPLHLAA